MIRATLPRLAVGVPLCLLCALAPGHPAASAPERSLAELLPAGAVALLEFDDLRGLTRRWSGSSLHQRFQSSRAARELLRSRLYLRLAQNAAQLEELLGFGLSLDRIAALAGRRSIIALYDVPTTSFVLISELSGDDAKRGELLDLGGHGAAREHRGIAYRLREGGRGRASLAVAVVGNRLVCGSDLGAFRGALVLAAAATGKPVAAGAPPAPLGADPDLRALLAAAPRDAPIRLWVDQKRLTGTHYFDDYWIFGRASGQGIDEALVALAPGAEATVESRLYLYAGSARPRVAEQPNLEIGRADPVTATAALPRGYAFASSQPATAGDLAAAIDDLMPRRDPAPPAEPRTARIAALAAALASARPARAIEVVDPGRSNSGAFEHHSGLAIGLEAPEALAQPALEQLLAAQLARSLSASTPEIGFVDEAGARVLRLPLVDEWALTLRRAGRHLVVATDPALARRLAASLDADSPAERLLAAPSPRLYHLDVARAALAWKGSAHLLAARENWSEAKHATLFDQSVGGLFDVARATREVLAFGYARGPRLYVEEVQYRER